MLRFASNDVVGACVTILAARFRPSFEASHPRKNRGRRECRVQAAPASLACKESALCARRQQQGSRSKRHSLRSDLRLIRALPGYRWCTALVRLATIAREIVHELDTSVGVSGPRGLAVRHSLIRPRRSALSQQHPSHPAPTSVTIAIRPSDGGGMRGYNHIFSEKRKNNIFREGA